ncbi:PR15B phosphatase, partial [Atrichornis clamosus]|nr:PR15B phosphatase [Atrichornis clamosus]
PAKAPPPLVLLSKPDTSLDWAEEPPEKRLEGGLEPPVGLRGAGLVRSSFGALPLDWYVLGLEQGKSHLPQPLRAEGLPEVELLRSNRLAFLQCWHLAVPDPDHGYHSLEEEQQQQHRGIRRETGEQRGDTGDLEQPEDPGRQPGGVPVEQEGIRDAAEEGEALAEEGDEDSEQNFLVSTRPVCANKLIDYIIGGVSSGEESEGEEEWDDDDDDDDDGFDSEELPSDSDAGSQDGERLHLWNSFYSLDPYNPQNFTATIQTSSSDPGKGMSDVEEGEEEGEEEEEEDSWAESSSGSPSSEEDEWDCESVDEAENLKLWNSFCSSDDPYNPLNFTAAFQTAERKGTPVFQGAERPSSVTAEPFAVCRLQLEKHNCGIADLGHKSANSKRKKVTFLEKVTEYYISSEEDRKGPWEEMARDGCRFQKRIQETEEAIGYCFSTEHRRRVFHRLQETSSQGVDLL